MRRTWVGIVLVTACASRASFDDAGTPAKDSGSPKDAASSDTGSLPDGGGDADSGTPTDSGQPPVDSGTPLDSGQPPADSGQPDSGVDGRCWVNMVGTRKCSQITPFELHSPVDGGSQFIVNCQQYQPPCPIGWKCEWLPNHEKGECIP